MREFRPTPYAITPSSVPLAWKLPPEPRIGEPWRSVILSWDTWPMRVDPAFIHTGFGLRIWFLAFSVIAGFVSVGAWVPGLREVIQLRPTVPLITALLCCLIAAFVGNAVRTGKYTTRVVSAGFVAVNLLHLLMTITPMLHASHMGAAFYGVVFTLAAIPPQIAQCSGPKTPWPTLATFVVGVVAALMAPDRMVSGMIFVALVPSVSFGLVLGWLASQQFDNRVRLSMKRSAYDARVMAEQVREADHARENVNQLLGKHHDARGTLLTMRFLLRRVQSAVETRRLADDDILDMLSEVDVLAERISRILQRSREEISAQTSHVLVATTIDPVIAAARAVYPDVEIQCTLADFADMRLDLLGGSLTLTRILDNLIRNACEGDGRRKATLVVITRPAPELMVIEDNGPGIPAALQDHIQPGYSTKTDGMGLGLYTTERLLQANHATLTLDTRPQGGTTVTVSFKPLGTASKTPTLLA